MCQHCGYDPGKSKVLQTITIFEKEIDGKPAMGAHFEATPEFEATDLMTFDAESITKTGYRVGLLAGELHDFGLALEVKQELDNQQVHESLVDLTSLGISKGND